MVVHLLPNLVWSYTRIFTVYRSQDETCMMTSITNPGVMPLRSDIHATFSCGVANKIDILHRFVPHLFFFYFNMFYCIKYLTTCMLVH